MSRLIDLLVMSSDTEDDERKSYSLDMVFTSESLKWFTVYYNFEFMMHSICLTFYTLYLL